MEFVAISMLAFLAEAFTEYLFSPLIDRLAPSLKEFLPRYVALAVGIFLAFNFQVDIFSRFFGLTSQIPYGGLTLTGMVLARGANFVNDFADRFLKK